ncbi:MAG TPA: hypothetical protein VMF89_28880, partial [Polyangiales bacterium]|nr:hypothetical protein [Polyangiales bacterium]
MSAAIRLACLWWMCTSIACSDARRTSSSETGNAATGAKQDTPATGNAGASGQSSGRAGSTAADSGMSPAAMSGIGGQSAAGVRAPSAGTTAQAGAAADAGMPDAGQRDAQTSPAECSACTDYGEPAAAGEVAPSELNALSGLALSRSQPDILFAHNDHDRPVVYALDLRGQLHARLTLEGAEAQDIEDIAVGKCDTKTCVYLADVGDNSAQ